MSDSDSGSVSGSDSGSDSNNNLLGDKEKDSPQYFDVALNKSFFRLATYTFLGITLATGYSMTLANNIPVEQGGGWTKESGWPLVDLRDNQIFRMFGYNNICLYIDDLPGKYLTAWFFELTIISYVGYAILAQAGVFLSFQRDDLTKLQLQVLRATSIVDVVCLTYAIEIFAVHPKENMLMHTLPFSSLMLGISVAGVRNVFHDCRCIDFEKAYLKHYAHYLHVIYGVSLLIISAWKHYIQYCGIVALNPPAPEWGQFNDKCWLLLAVVIPWVKAFCEIYFPFLLPRKDQFLHIRVRSGYGTDECECCSGRRLHMEKQT